MNIIKNNINKMIKLMGQEEKILIIGAKGNLGSQLARVLGNDYRLLLWDKEELDITNKETLAKKILKHKPGIIINTAAYNAVDKCEDEAQEYELAKMLNGAAVGYLADVALKLDAVLVHFVSDYVFSGDKKEGYSEADQTRSISRYGDTKIMGEEEINKRVKQGLKYYLIRTSKLFGPRGTGETTKESFFDLILRLSKEQKEFKMVHNEEIGCFTYTLDLARVLKDLLEADEPYGIYHIGNEGPASWYDAAKYLFMLKGIKDVKLIPVSSSDYQRPAKRPKYSVLLNTKLPKLRSWQEALREYLQDE